MGVAVEGPKEAMERQEFWGRWVFLTQKCQESELEVGEVTEVGGGGKKIGCR